MKFKEVYVAVMNKREKELDKVEVLAAVSRQSITLRQQQDALNRCVFGRKRCNTGKKAKVISADSGGNTKYTPWMFLLESDSVLAKFDSIYKMYDRLSTVKKHLGVE
jgi:hypothetical protein